MNPHASIGSVFHPPPLAAAVLLLPLMPFLSSPSSADLQPMAPLCSLLLVPFVYSLLSSFAALCCSLRASSPLATLLPSSPPGVRAAERPHPANNPPAANSSPAANSPPAANDLPANDLPANDLPASDHTLPTTSPLNDLSAALTNVSRFRIALPCPFETPWAVQRENVLTFPPPPAVELMIYLRRQHLQLPLPHSS
jgi:hypothetical protein